MSEFSSDDNDGDDGDVVDDDAAAAATADDDPRVTGNCNLGPSCDIPIRPTVCTSSPARCIPVPRRIRPEIASLFLYFQYDAAIETHAPVESTLYTL